MNVIKFPDFLNHTAYITMFGKLGIVAPYEFFRFYDEYVKNTHTLTLNLESLEFVVEDSHVGYLRRSEPVDLELFVSGNYFEGVVGHDCLGVIATLFVLSNMCMAAYHKGWNFNHLSIASDALKNKVDLREDRSTIWRAID